MIVSSYPEITFTVFKDTVDQVSRYGMIFIRIVFQAGELLLIQIQLAKSGLGSADPQDIKGIFVDAMDHVSTDPAFDPGIMRKTREIGSLKAFGARDRTIFKIFLYQGLIIGFVAGLLGIILSIIVMNLVNYYGINVEFIAGTQLKIGFIINWLTLLIAILLPVVLSVIAAAIPAKKASMLSPVEALRKGELSL